MLRIPLLIVFVLITAALAASAEFQTLRPKAAQQEYEAKISGLLVQLERDMNQARQKYIDALKTALDDTTRAGNLDEALRIRQAIELQENLAPRERPLKPRLTPEQRILEAQLIGTRWEAPASTRQFGYDAIATQERDGRKTLPWAALDGRTVAIRDGDVVEVIVFSDDLSQAGRSAYKVGKSNIVWKRAK